MWFDFVVTIHVIVLIDVLDGGDGLFDSVEGFLERLSFVSFLPSLGSLVLVRLHVGQEEGQIRLGSLAQRLPPRRAGDSWERGCRRQCLGSWGAQAGELSALPVGALARGCALMFTGCRHRFSLKRNALRLRV